MLCVYDVLFVIVGYCLFTSLASSLLLMLCCRVPKHVYNVMSYVIVSTISHYTIRYCVFIIMCVSMLCCMCVICMSVLFAYHYCLFIISMTVMLYVC